MCPPDIDLAVPVVRGGRHHTAQWVLLATLPDGVPFPGVVSGKLVTIHDQLDGIASPEILNVLVRFQRTSVHWNEKFKISIS